MRLLGLSLYGPQAASHRVRLSQFQPGLASADIDLQVQSLLDDAYIQRCFAGGRPSLRALLTSYGRRIQALRQMKHFELAIVYAELLPLIPAWLEKRLLQLPYILDLDDAFYLKYRSGRLSLLCPFLGAKIDRLMVAAAAVTAGNHQLFAYAQRFNANVHLLPSVVDTDLLRPLPQQPPATADASFTVGWIGSPSTAPYLDVLIEPLQQLACERPVRLLVVGGPAPVIPGVEVIEQSWHLDQEPVLIQQFDVGVMPLPDTPWARGKCAYKLIQCLACGVPVVASPVGANVDVVSHSCGLLASSSTDWLMAFKQLADDPQRRGQLGAAGRRWVEQRYSLRSALPKLEHAIRGVVARSHSMHQL